MGLVSSLEVLFLAKLDQNAAGSLWGSLPSELGQLTKLQQISLWANQLSSTLPTELGAMKDMKYMLMMTNQFSGPIPSELGNIE